MFKNGDQREVKFDKPGIVRLGCNIHANMAAYLIVVDAPHYVVGRCRRCVLVQEASPPACTRCRRGATAAPTESQLVIKAGNNDRRSTSRAARPRARVQQVRNLAHRREIGGRPRAVRNVAAALLALSLTSCSFAVKHPAVTAGLVGGGIALAAASSHPPSRSSASRLVAVPASASP